VIHGRGFGLAHFSAEIPMVDLYYWTFFVVGCITAYVNFRDY
jgi:hypothetical protein